MKTKIEIWRDTTSESPREWCNIGTITHWHRTYDALGDARISRDDAEEFIAQLDKEDALYLPVYMYDHGGIALKTSPFSCRWDSGQVGVIHISKERARREQGVKRITKKTRKRILDYLDDEIRILDLYVRGDVYGITEFYEEDPLVSIGGFYAESREDLFNQVIDHFKADNHEAIHKAIENYFK
jgi:hypothetical protein